MRLAAALGFALVALWVPASAHAESTAIRSMRLVAGGSGGSGLSAKPWLDPDQVKAVLTQSAVDLPERRVAEGFGRIDLRRALALPTPAADAVAQRFAPARLDLDELRRELADADPAMGPGAQWTGRRWSGRRWSGRRWSGATWIDGSGS